MEFLLTDSANSSQLGSLANASIKPSAKAEDFAHHLVKDLKALPRSTKAVGLAIDKPLSSTDASAKEPAELANPLELLKQLDNAKQVAEDLSSPKNTSQLAQAKLDVESGVSAEEQSTESLAMVEEQQADPELALDPESKQDQPNNDSQSTETSRQIQPEQSGRDLPPSHTVMASSAPSVQQDESLPTNDETELAEDSASRVAVKTAQQDTTQVAAKSVETSAVQAEQSKQTEQMKVAPEKNINLSEQTGSDNEAEQTVELRAQKSATANSDKAHSVVNLKAGEGESAKQQASIQSVIDKAPVTGKTQKVDSSQASDIDTSKLDSSPKVNEAGKTAETTSASVTSQQKVFSAEQTKVAETDTNHAKQTPPLVGTKTDTSSVLKSSNEAAVAKTQVEQKASNEPAERLVSEQAKVDTSSVSKPSNESVVAKTQVEQKASNELGVRLVSEQAHSSEHTTRIASETKPGVLQSDSVAKAKNAGEQAQSFSEKNLTNQASKTAMNQQHEQHGSDEQREPQTQGYTTQHALHATDSTRQPESASLFRVDNGLNGINRTDSSHQELGLKQAQLANQTQLNDKASLVGERLNPAHYQAPAELNQRVQYMLSQGMQKAEIRLDPAELGSMHVRLQMNQDQQVSVHIQVQNPQAKEALEQTMPRLRDMLQQQGIELGQSQVNQQHQGNASHQGQGQASFSSIGGEHTESAEDLAEQDLTSVLAKQTNSDGIDYYA